MCVYNVHTSMFLHLIQINLRHTLAQLKQQLCKNNFQLCISEYFGVSLWKKKNPKYFRILVHWDDKHFNEMLSVWENPLPTSSHASNNT